MDENPAVAVTKVNGCTEHADGENSFTEKYFEATDFYVSRGNTGKSVVAADRTKLSLSSDLWIV